ncbi:MAG: site-2 protease family protein [Chloroflexia bacterium]
MNTGTLKIATIGGVAIKLQWSLLIILAIVTVSLATGQIPDRAPGESAAFYWITGVIGAILFLVSILLHELSHSFVARKLGYGVSEIILFIFGGVANMEEEPKKAGHEFVIAGVGPLTSLILAGVFYLLQFLTPPLHKIGAGASAIFDYLAFINFLLAVFNMIPGFPLDGGRVLRSIIWAINRNFGSATRIAGTIGQVVAYIFIALGIYQTFSQGNYGGLWLAFVGWFILNAAQSSVASVVMRETFRGAQVLNLMEPPPPTIRPTSTLAHLFSQYIIPYNLRAVHVTDPEGKLEGVVTLNDIKEVQQDQFGIATVGEYMIGVDHLQPVLPTDGLDKAMTILSQSDLDQLPVVDATGRFIAILSRARILRWLQLRDQANHPPSQPPSPQPPQETPVPPR